MAKAPRVRKVPMRRCTGCQASRPKREMVRVVRAPEGGVVYDPTGKRSGRGAYLCPGEECLTASRKRGSLARSLEVAIDEPTWQQLEQACRESRPGGQGKR